MSCLVRCGAPAFRAELREDDGACALPTQRRGTNRGRRSRKATADPSTSSAVADSAQDDSDELGFVASHPSAKAQKDGAPAFRAELFFLFFDGLFGVGEDFVGGLSAASPRT